MAIKMEQIYQDYYSRLHSFIHKRVRDLMVTEDLLQDVFLKALTKIDTLKSTEKIESWLYQITRNTIIDYYRAYKPEAELPESLGDSSSGFEDFYGREIKECLWPIIGTLPEKYRETIVMVDLEGMTQKETALRLNISLSGIKSRAQRGRAYLKKILLRCCRLEFDHSGRMVDCEPKKHCTC